MSLFRFLFSRGQCLVYTAFGSEAYARVAAKLDAAGVAFRTETYSNSRRFARHSPREDNVQFDIYVAKEDEHKAQLAIHA